MADTAFDDAVMHTMQDLLRASRECETVDPGMAAQFAATAEGMSRDLGIDIGQLGVLRHLQDNPIGGEHETGGAPADVDFAEEEVTNEEDEEFDQLLHLIALQRKALQPRCSPMAQPAKRDVGGWFNLNHWARR